MGAYGTMEKNKNGILLETGTNEIEIMEFTIDGNLYGINVAKVREVMVSAPVRPVPHAHPSVEGIFKPRDTVITVVDLPRYLMNRDFEKQEKDLFIVTNFNKMYIAFRVHSVEGIVRMSWRDIQKPDKTISGGKEGVATGIAQYGEDLITILDFEKIAADISPQTTIQMDEVKKMRNRRECSLPIWIAEDSVLLSKIIEESLTTAGYDNIRSFSNGQELWDTLQEVNQNGVVDEQVSLIITDLEMPQMDGHRLTKLVKTDKDLQRIPVVIFSSLISREMWVKGKEVGADEQLSKPEIGHLVDVIDRLLEKRAEEEEKEYRYEQ